MRCERIARLAVARTRLYNDCLRLPCITISKRIRCSIWRLSILPWQTRPPQHLSSRGTFCCRTARLRCDRLRPNNMIIRDSWEVCSGAQRRGGCATRRCRTAQHLPRVMIPAPRSTAHLTRCLRRGVLSGGALERPAPLKLCRWPLAPYPSPLYRWAPPAWPQPSCRRAWCPRVQSCRAHQARAPSCCRPPCS